MRWNVGDDMHAGSYGCDPTDLAVVLSGVDTDGGDGFLEEIDYEDVASSCLHECQDREECVAFQDADGQCAPHVSPSINGQAVSLEYTCRN